MSGDSLIRHSPDPNLVIHFARDHSQPSPLQVDLQGVGIDAVVYKHALANLHGLELFPLGNPATPLLWQRDVGVNGFGFFHNVPSSEMNSF